MRIVSVNKCTKFKTLTIKIFTYKYPGWMFCACEGEWVIHHHTYISLSLSLSLSQWTLGGLQPPSKDAEPGSYNSTLACDVVPFTCQTRPNIVLQWYTGKCMSFDVVRSEIFTFFDRYFSFSPFLAQDTAYLIVQLRCTLSTRRNDQRSSNDMSFFHGNMCKLADNFELLQYFDSLWTRGQNNTQMGH